MFPASFSRRPALALLALAPLAACTVGPDYQPPEPRIAAQWVGEADLGAVREGDWWTTLRDPMLDALVAEMLAGSPTLREAQARIAEARATRDAVRGRTGPQAQVGASANEVTLSENGQIPIGNIPGFERSFGMFDIGFDASWEIDLWGRRTRQIEAADARAAQAALAAQGVRLQLIAELARAYVDLRLAQSEVALAGEAAETRTALARLTEMRAQAGEATGMEADQAASDAANAEGALANAQARERGAALRVANLVGVAPADMLPRLAPTAPIPQPPAAIGAGLPSELLRRRPDVRAAERELAAATADVGVATADLFPRLRLSLSVGQQARAVSDLFSGDSSRLQAGPGLSWPIFSGGAAKAQVRVADARAAQAAARYDGAVLSALTDSEAAINRFDRSVTAFAATQAATRRDEAAFNLARQREAAGEDDRLALARARLAWLAARQRHAQAQAAATDAAIGLHKALGGGWESAGS